MSPPASSSRDTTPTATDVPEDWMDEDDDDMEFHESTENEVTEDDSFMGDEVDDDFFDAEEGSGVDTVDIELIDPESGETIALEDIMEAESTETESSPPPAQQTEQPPRRSMVTRSMLLQLLGREGIRHLLADHSTSRIMGTADDDDDSWSGSRTRPKRAPYVPPKGPSKEGQRLQQTGDFGTNERNEGTFARQKRMAYQIFQRELALGCPGRERSRNKIMRQSMIPSSTADTIIHYDDKCYSGQFSDDGNFFFSCAQDFKVRMYDTSNPYKWKYYKTVRYPYGQWTITDASLSPDNRYLAYTSIKSIIALANTDPGETSEPFLLDISDTGRGGRRVGYGRFGIWSLRFSGDGREIVAGTSDRCIYVYDIESRKSILQIYGHTDEVNAVCFGDKSSPHVLYSGSDDTTIKVWDRRSMGDGRPAGVFLGHTEGLTYVDSKGDGRYVLSNGKDQTMKLWDLRSMMSTDRADQIDPMQYKNPGFDYRFMPFRMDQYQPHPNDCSLVTFRGHSVLKTLIRCHFSPPGSTDSRYVYSGSENGGVYIYNIDGTLAGKVDVSRATYHTRPRDPSMTIDAYESYGGTNWKTCVRDASWHPNAPVIAATAWNGWGSSLGTCTVHSWNDGIDDDEAEPKMGHRVNGELENERELYQLPAGAERPSPLNRARRSRRRVVDDEAELGAL